MIFPNYSNRIEYVGNKRVIYYGRKMQAIGKDYVTYDTKNPNKIIYIGKLPVKYSTSNPEKIEYIGDMKVTYDN